MKLTIKLTGFTMVLVYWISMLAWVASKIGIIALLLSMVLVPWIWPVPVIGMLFDGFFWWSAIMLGLGSLLVRVE